MKMCVFTSKCWGNSCFIWVTVQTLWPLSWGLCFLVFSFSHANEYHRSISTYIGTSVDNNGLMHWICMNTKIYHKPFAQEVFISSGFAFCTLPKGIATPFVVDWTTSSAEGVSERVAYMQIHLKITPPRERLAVNLLQGLYTFQMGYRPFL